MATIKRIDGFKVLDSRGNETIKVCVYSDYFVGSAIVPRGASKGKFEAVEKEPREALEILKKIVAPKIIGLESSNQWLIDATLRELDGTENFSYLGGNVSLGVSLAVSRLSATEFNLPLYQYIGGISGSVLPMPMFNVLNGGMHAKNNIDIQEMMIIPLSAKSFEEAVEMGSTVYQNLKKILEEKGMITSLGDEGGFAPRLNNNEEGIELLISAIVKSNYLPGKDIALALDVAANSFFDEEKKTYRYNGRDFTSFDMIALYEEMIEKYPLISIEDPLAEEDELYPVLCQTIGAKVFLVGDDLFVTDEQRLKVGIANKVANAILIKPNQTGTLTKTLNTLSLANLAGMISIISHRSGDSEDSYVADLAVGKKSLFVKFGAPARSERTSKYNRLLEISHNSQGIKFAGYYLQNEQRIQNLNNKYNS